VVVQRGVVFDTARLELLALVVGTALDVDESIIRPWTSVESGLAV
jgi:hypothetical protein